MKMALGAAALALMGGAQAVTVTSYDVTGAQPSGFGGWSHSYTGSISGGNYSGGSGSLNDGVIPTGVGGDQLFTFDTNPTITLHLDGTTKVSTINIFGGDNPYNYIPGTLTGWSVTIGGNTQAFTSTGFGASCTSGLCSDAVSLAGSGLDLLATDTLTLSNFQGGWYGYFSAGEITVNGAAAAPVPEPETYALMLGGLGVMGLLARRRRSSR
ncbi:PEP-CTERM sorting domain-containing protein [Piscinibacter terrae]|uniref:PEP-CTERM sorting domain-containing protein n=1 Tax=Piscinibacter terrae TaxID=2496871 RepID=UPI001F33E94D|nr:PEP-CTERM sorting domain-containing protein [Albitalea terrae]